MYASKPLAVAEPEARPRPRVRAARETGPQAAARQPSRDDQAPPEQPSSQPHRNTANETSNHRVATITMIASAPYPEQLTPHGPQRISAMTEPTSDSSLSPDNLSVVVRPLPKVVFFYLTWLVSGICALLTPDATTGLIWMGTFFFNLLVISFDFNEERSIIAVLAVVVGAFCLTYFDMLGSVSAWLTGLQPIMSSTFYWMIFAGFSAVFITVWMRTRFDYWEFRPNEIVHRYGIFPKMKRYSTEDLRWDKTVPDMLERVLLGTGSIVLTTPHEKHPVILEHVMRIGYLDDRIADILGVKQVIHVD
ncbi:MAG: hypothetical protein ACI9EF_000749 [Pseudohongiellaceae bacterium]|jgi:hypothetical protein